MKEYNIIEVVEYLMNNPDAIFIRNNANNFKLAITDEDEIITKSLYDENEYDDLRYEDIRSKWILQTPHRTHAEIMKNWFRWEETGKWQKVVGYDPKKETYFFDNHSAGGYFRKYFDNCEMKTDEEIQEMED